MNQPHSFGEWLRRRRRALDWTQEELAKQAGCAVGTIRKIEADGRRPSKQLAEILAQRLDIPPKDREDLVRFAREVLGDAFPTLPLAQETASLAPTRRDAKPTHNLPAQLTSFIGREHEMAEVRQLLETTRLLTLTGAGGTGKTRLALQVAAELLDAERFPDGIWFVELAPLADPALVVQDVVTTLGLRERRHCARNDSQGLLAREKSAHPPRQLRASARRVCTICRYGPARVPASQNSREQSRGVGCHRRDNLPRALTLLPCSNLRFPISLQPNPI